MSTYRENHFGIGAANHFSSTSSPLFWILKQRSTVDGEYHNGKHGFSSKFLRKLRNGNLKIDDLIWQSMRCSDMEREKSNWVPLTRLSQKTRAVLKNSLPVALQKNRARYRFYHPDPQHEWKVYEEKCIREKTKKVDSLA